MVEFVQPVVNIGVGKTYRLPISSVVGTNTSDGTKITSPLSVPVVISNSTTILISTISGRSSSWVWIDITGSLIKVQSWQLGRIK